MTLPALNDNERLWARVELFRWQHGGLPIDNDTRLLNEAAGLIAMAEAMERGDPSNFPTIFNVVVIMRYMAERVGEMGNNGGSHDITTGN